MSTLKGLDKAIKDFDDRVSLALSKVLFLETLLKWTPHPEQFEAPEIYYQGITLRPLKVVLAKWTFEAACFWVSELAILIGEDYVLHKGEALYFSFSFFDVDVTNSSSCYFKKTGERINVIPEGEWVCL